MTEVIAPRGFNTPVKLGRSGVRRDHRTLKISWYLGATQLPASPPAVHWGKSRTASWGMLGNDRFGDCTCAGACHQMQTWLAAGEHVQQVFTEDDALAAYSAVTGFDKNDPNTDQGAMLLDVLKYWQHTGVAGRQVAAYAELNPQNRAEVKAVINTFGGAYMGVALPLSAQGQKTWKVSHFGGSQPGSWGGHCVNFVGYDSKYVELVTWGTVIKATWGFVERYFDEGYAVVSPDWLDANGKTPNGLDLTALMADVQRVAA